MGESITFKDIDKLHETGQITEKEMYQMKADHSRYMIEELLDQLHKVAEIPRND